MRRLKRFEDENARLKRIVADLTLDPQMVSELLKDMNIDCLDYALGAPDEVVLLPEILGMTVNDMHRRTLTWVNRCVFHTDDEVLIGAIHLGEDLRFCPACLRDDAEGTALLGQPAALHLRERLIWRFKAVRRCIALQCIDRPDEEKLIGLFPAQLVASFNALQPGGLRAYIADRLAGFSPRNRE